MYKIPVRPKTGVWLIYLPALIPFRPIIFVELYFVDRSSFADQAKIRRYFVEKFLRKI